MTKSANLPSLTRLLALASLLIFATTAGLPTAWAQDDLLGGLDLGIGKAGHEIELSAKLTSPDFKPGSEAVLTVTAVLPEAFYIYSTNPAFGGATKLTVLDANGLEPIDQDFRADREPKVVFHPEFGEKGQHIEKYFDTVTWFRRYRIKETMNGKPTKLGDVEAAVKVQGQYCGGKTSASCIPIRPARVLLAGVTDGPIPEVVKEQVEASRVLPYTASITPMRGGTADPVRLDVSLSPENARVGQTVKLAVTMNVSDPAVHTFGLDQNPKNAATPTELKFNLKNLKAGSEFKPDHPPKIESTEYGEQQHHFGKVTWTRDLVVTGEGYGVDGSVKYQICKHSSCQTPKTIPIKLGFQPTSIGGPAAKIDLTNFQPELDDDAHPVDASLGTFLLYAFLGGMILNVMPCVLPVIAIKVLSFVQQAGESRGRIFALNVAYAGGVMCVFVLLATLAVGPQELGWGGLFQKAEFNLFMACAVFAMGLSLLGVFEIPIPGFVGSAAGNQHQEGLTGAFMTGIFATLLATPCSGPFLGATLAWSVQQPKVITYLVWTMMGFGMAFPYLVFGVFPAAIKWLPRPGNWMVRFKEIAGFVLMGSVIFIISFISQKFIVPALIMLMGTAFSLWMIGNLYDFNSGLGRKTLVRMSALAMAVLICGYGYRMTRADHDAHRLPWKDFTEAGLSESLGAKTVLIDFSADWCLACKTNEKYALNTPRTQALVKQYGVVPFYADYTQESPEIKKWLERFNSDSIPLTVIFPAGQPHRAIVLRDLYTESALLAKLQSAVGANATPKLAATSQAAVQTVDRK